MKESEFGGSPERESRDYAADELPEIQSTAIDKDAITERILDKVIDVAERDEPLERQYETAHEHKGETQGHGSYAPMQSIGDIINTPDQTQMFQDQNAVSPNGQINPAHQTSFTDTPATTGLSYKQAIKYGFITAILFAAITAVVLA